MFNFTTQSVYNNIATSGSNKNLWVASSGEKPTIRIGNTRFEAADIEKVYIKKPTPEFLTEVTFNMSDILAFVTDGDNTTAPNKVNARIALYIGLSMNNQDSFYANDLLYKGKPIFIEFYAKKGETATLVATRVKNIATKYVLLVAGEKILDVTTSSGTITFTGINGYQQLKSAKLQVYNPDAKTVDCCTTEGDFEDVKVGVPVAYTIESGVLAAVEDETSHKAKKVAEDGTLVEIETNEVPILPGIEAFGDYNWIIHNLRLPTAANTGFWAPTKQEMPAVGQTYTQFTIKMAKERDGIAGEAVGMRATSVTTHVLYVAGDYSDASSNPAKTVYTQLNTLVSSKIDTSADTRLETPYSQN